MGLTRRNASGDCPHPEPPHHPDRLTKDGFGHLAVAFGPVHEHDRDLDNAKPLPPGPEAHLDLKRITIRSDVVEIDRLENSASEALEAAGRVPYGQTSDHSGIDVG